MAQKDKNPPQEEVPSPQKDTGLKPGGTEGGDGLFLGGIGLVVMALGFYLLLDSVRVVSGGYGTFSRMIGGGRAGLETTSMGIVFLPFMVGIGALFYDASKRWAWVVSGLGFLVIAIEILSRIQFVMNVKTSHLLMILAMVAAGAGMLAKAYRTGQLND